MARTPRRGARRRYAALAGATLAAGLIAAAPAAAVTPNIGEATADGDASEWDLGADPVDFIAELDLFGSQDDSAGIVQARYSCTDERLRMLFQPSPLVETVTAAERDAGGSGAALIAVRQGGATFGLVDGDVFPVGTDGHEGYEFERAIAPGSTVNPFAVFAQVLRDVSNPTGPFRRGFTQEFELTTPDCAPDLEPIQISKQTVDTGVTGHWRWKMGKWTTSKLESEATGPRPYDFKVLVDSHGFKVTRARIISRVTLTNPNDVPVSGTLTDLLPGWACEVNGAVRTLPANSQTPVATRCSFDGDPSGPVTNTATFTPADDSGLDPVSDQATTAIDETPPANSPGQRVVLRDPMWHQGKKPLRHLDAVGGPWSITAAYRVNLIPPVTPGKCWWHHNTAHLFDVKTTKKVTSSNRVSVFICRPKAAPAGKDPKTLPPTDKHGVPIVTPRLGGPKVIPRKYRTKLRTRVFAPKRVHRGQAFRVKVATRNMTKRKAFGTIVKVKIPKGLRVATRQRGITTRGRYAWWTLKQLRGKRTLKRTITLVPTARGARRVIAISNARNAKRSGHKKVVRVLRPRRGAS